MKLVIDRLNDTWHIDAEGVVRNTRNRPADKGHIRDLQREGHTVEWTIVQDAAYAEYLTKVLGDYAEAQAKRTPEQIAEEQFEMRAAFGPGVEVVNVITGEKTRT